MPHEHHHGACGCEHDDDAHVDPNEGTRDLLYARIDLDNVEALNEVAAGSGKKLIRPWDRRLDETDKFVDSDADEQLILRIPFTGQVKLRSIILKPAPGDSCPTAMRVYANQRLDFDDVEGVKPTLEIEVVQPTDTSSREPVEYAVRAAKFPAVRNLTLFFPTNGGADSTRLYFLGFRGEWTELKEEAIEFVYEAQANPADHAKIRGTATGMAQPEH